jgi:capsular exopolysaccharide synthesis family protein
MQTNINSEERLSSNGKAPETSQVDLFHLLTLLRRYLWLFVLTVGGVLGLTILITLLLRPMYEAKGQLLMEQDNKASELTGLSEKLGGLDSLTSQGNPLETQAQVLLSGPVLSQTIAAEDLRTDEGKPLSIEDFRDLLKVKAIRNTDVLEVSFRDPSPEKAAKTLKTLFQYYLLADVQANRAQTRAAREFIVSQLPRTEQDLRKTESALRKFKEGSRVINLEAEGQAAVEGMGKLTEALAEAQAQYAVAKKSYEQLRQKLALSPAQAIAAGALSEASGFQGTLKQLQQIEDQITVSQENLRDDHPKMIELGRQRKALQAALQERVGETIDAKASSVGSGNVQKGEFGLELTTELVKADVAQKSAAERVGKIQEFLKLYKERTDVIPRLEQQQVQLERRAEVGRQTYQNLLKSLQDAQLAENQNVGNARVLDPPRIPIEPVWPKPILNAVLGGILGIVSGVGVVLLLDTLDRKIRTMSELRSTFSYLVLGVIPSFDIGAKGNRQKQVDQHATDSLVMRHSPRSTVSETYRALLANLKFSRSDNPLRVIVVTSCLPGEGKSTTVANLALAMEELGARVIVIDADLRRPSQHTVWEVPNAVGLSNVLVDDAILGAATRIESERLSLLTSGVLPPSSIPLLDSARMESVLEDLSTTFDYILIDTPPLMVGADALVLAKKADGLLLVCRPELLNRSAATRGKELLSQIEEKVIGMVVNCIKNNNENEGYYYYSEDYYSSNHSIETKNGKFSKTL